jgi:thymidylate synthase
MATLFEAETADELWQAAATALISKESARDAESRLGHTYELLHCTLTLRNPRARWVLSRRPPINPAFAIVESFWILAGRQDADLVNFWNPALPRYAGSTETYHGAYGHRIRRHFQVDQLERAYHALHHNSPSRQVVLQIWDPRIDLPNDDGQPTAPDIPCNLLSCLKVRDGRLEWLQVMRSSDVYRGTPYNLVQFTLLQEILAGWLRLDLGDFVLVTDSLHLYEEDVSVMEVGELDQGLNKCDHTLALPKTASDRVIQKVIVTLESLSSTALAPSSLRSLCLDNSLPVPYRDLILICAADACRRRGWAEEERWAIDCCRSPVLQLAHGRWAARMAAPKA